jgi:ribosomal protein S20
MKKLTNVQKVLNALQSGPKTQANLVRETKVKNVYQIISDAVKKGLLTKENGLVKLNGLPVAIDEIKKPKTEDPRMPLYKESSSKIEEKNEHVDRIAMLKDEIDNIDDGIRALSITRSYLLRRCQEESRHV